MNKMSNFDGYSRFLTWFMALMLSALVAGCGSGGSDALPVAAAAPAATTKALTAYSFAAFPGVAATIDEAAKTIAVTLPNGTAVTALKATFTTTGAGVKVGTSAQTSAATANDFTGAVDYVVSAADGSTSTYTVTVTVASPTAKATTGFSFAGLPGAVGSIDEATKTIAVSVPSGTDVTALVSTFATTGTVVKVGAAVQTSGVTANNFTAPVAYTVTDAIGNSATYTVTVTAATAASKATTAFSFAGYPAVAGTIDETAKTIAVSLPNGSSVTALVAKFATTGSTVKVGTTVQTSGVTANDFTNPVAYVVTAADGSAVTYTVTVTVAAGSAKVVTAYSIAGFPLDAGVIDETVTPKTIAVNLPKGTDVTALIAKFTTTGISAKVGTKVQVSTATANDFTTSPVAYLVSAADGSAVTYNVSITLGKGPAPVNLGVTGGAFVLLSQSGVTDVPTSAIVGDVGSSPITGAAILLTCTEVTGSIYSVDAAGPAPCVLPNSGTRLTAAVGEMQAAYTDAAGRAIPDATNLGAGDISGLTLTPGLYKWTTGVAINTDVTLSGGRNDVWIFQISGNLNLANATKILLLGGALPKNIFWQVVGDGVADVTLGTTSHFEGIILSKNAINLRTGASINGRLYAQKAVTLQSSTVTKPAP
jgi:hypothetical protein